MSLHDLVKSSTNVDAIRDLIVSGAKLDEADKLKRTPLHMAAWSGNLEALQLLIRAGASLDAKAMDGFTPLHFAAQSSAESIAACIRFLVKKNKGLLNMRITKGNKSALHLAAAKGNVTAVTALLEVGADVNAKTTSGQVPADLAKTPQIKTLLTGFGAQKESSIEDDSDDEEVENNEEESASAGGAMAVAAPAAGVEVPGEEVKADIGSKKRPISEVTPDES